MTLTARPRLGILLVVLAALAVAAATLVLYSGSTKPVQAQQTCLLGQVNDFKVESSGGAFTATWDYPDGCDATTFPDDFSLQVHWKRVFSINVGSDGDGVTWDDGSWDDFRVASCEQATVTTMCTFGRNTIETGEQFVVRVETIGNNGEETTRRVEAWPVVASNPPDPVTGTVASPEANDSCTVTSGRKATPIELSWNAVSGISNYQIWRAGPENTFSESFRSDRVLASNVSGTSYTDNTHTRGRQTYQYVVFPRRSGTAYLDGKWSVALVQTPGPNMPRNISAADGDREDTKFTVSWSTPSDDGGCDITGYAIYLYEYKYLADGSVVVDSDGELPFVSEGTAGASATSWESPSMTRTYRADGRDYGRQFHVEVRAVTAHGEGVPGATLFTDWIRPIPPNAPRDLRFTEQISRALPLGWDPPDSDGGSPVTRYTVMYQPNGDGSGSGSTETRSGGAGYGSRGVRSGGVYGLDARTGVVVGANPRSENRDGKDGGGSVETSGTSVTIEGLTDGVEYIVRVVAHNAVGESPPSDPITGTPGGPENTPATGAPTISGTVQVGKMLRVVTSSIADDDGLDDVSFSYQWLADDANIAGATNSSYTLTSGEQGQAIEVRVSFADDGGNQETLTSEPTAAVLAVEPADPPPAPTNLTAVVDNGNIVLNWQAPSDDSITGYQVLRRRPTQGEKTLLVYVADTSSTATTYTDTNVKAGIRHVYRVKAINAAGLSRWSNYVRATP